jgi:hypothetical protein
MQQEQMVDVVVEVLEEVMQEVQDHKDMTVEMDRELSHLEVVEVEVQLEQME